MMMEVDDGCFDARGFAGCRGGKMEVSQDARATDKVDDEMTPSSSYAPRSQDEASRQAVKTRAGCR